MTPEHSPEHSPEHLADLSARAYRHMKPWRAQDFADTLGNPHALLVSTKHAFVLGMVIVDEAEILALAVDPACQRQGLASQVLNTFHNNAQARGATRVLLEVASKNAPARAFYSAQGYVHSGTRRAYYPQTDGPADDALIMSRALP